MRIAGLFRLQDTRAKLAGALLTPCLAALIFSAFTISHTWAKSPAIIAEGKMLFEKNWTPRNPQLGNDGLGPLFNGSSCVACHHQGGIGGGGDARFNSKTVGIDRMKISGKNVTNDMVKKAISDFHPGFIGPTGSILNTFSISHHGGSKVFQQSRKSFLKSIPAVFSEHGGPVSADEVRQANATPILYAGNLGNRKVSIRARLYQRNTPAMFGAGLIDQIPGKDIVALVKAQEKHPEISGRPATLSDGEFGRFGWRGNIPSLLDFCDQACANELGLETKRLPQPIDPTIPAYRNHSADISDSQIKAMAAFVASLPAPTRELPDDSEKRELALRGEQVFASVGCAVCHTPNVGPAKGIYSDILLHDMGYESMDLNRADPYIYKVTPVSTTRVVGQTTTRTMQSNGTGYYSGSSSMSQTVSTPGGGNRMTGSRRSLPSLAGNGSYYDFVAPTQPTQLVRIFDLENDGPTRMVSNTSSNVSTFSRRGSTRTTRRSVTQTTAIQEDRRLRLSIKPTKFNQEWRTPPLWGVRDSAPYMHDGRAETLLEAITMHEGEAAKTRDRFLNLSVVDRQAVIEFLNTMVAPEDAPQPAL